MLDSPSVDVADTFRIGGAAAPNHHATKEAGNGNLADEIRGCANGIRALSRRLDALAARAHLPADLATCLDAFTCIEEPAAARLDAIAEKIDTGGSHG